MLGPMTAKSGINRFVYENNYRLKILHIVNYLKISDSLLSLSKIKISLGNLIFFGKGIWHPFLVPIKGSTGLDKKSAHLLIRDRSLITTWGGSANCMRKCGKFFGIARKLALPPTRIRGKFGFPPQQVTVNGHFQVFVCSYSKEIKLMCKNQDYQRSKKISSPPPSACLKKLAPHPNTPPPQNAPLPASKGTVRHISRWNFYSIPLCRHGTDSLIEPTDK